MYHEDILKREHRGLTIEIYQDTDAESPDEWKNEDVFLAAYHDDIYVPHDTYTKDICVALYDPDMANYDWQIERAKEIKKKFWVFGVEAYIHSGIVLALDGCGNFPDRRWDVSIVGILFVRKKEYRLSKSARKAAYRLINTWNQYLGGDVWNYTVENEDGDILDACGGYYGLKWCEEEAMDAANHAADREQKQKEKKLKEKIINRVPLYAR